MFVCVCVMPDACPHMDAVSSHTFALARNPGMPDESQAFDAAGRVVRAFGAWRRNWQKMPKPVLRRKMAKHCQVQARTTHMRQLESPFRWFLHVPLPAEPRTRSMCEQPICVN